MPNLVHLGDNSKAWIAGLVVGGIVGLLLLISLLFILRRRRQKSAQTPEDGWAKAELPADCVPPNKPEEVEDREISELAGSFPPPAETTLYEVATNELPQTNDAIPKNESSSTHN
jgi:hypothetical protein